MSLSRLKALALLHECTGDDIWSLSHCRQRGVPAEWLDELSDCFESGFQADRETIYVGKRVVNQYQGIRDVDLAQKLAQWLGVEVQHLSGQALSRAHWVRLIQEAVEEA